MKLCCTTKNSLFCLSNNIYHSISIFLTIYYKHPVINYMVWLCSDAHGTYCMCWNILHLTWHLGKHPYTSVLKCRCVTANLCSFLVTCKVLIKQSNIWVLKTLSNCKLWQFYEGFSVQQEISRTERTSIEKTICITSKVSSFGQFYSPLSQHFPCNFLGCQF